jgi:hypothetical protein
MEEGAGGGRLLAETCVGNGEGESDSYRKKIEGAVSTRRRGDMGKAVMQQPYRWRSGGTAGQRGGPLRQALSGRGGFGWLSEWPYTRACMAPPRPANQGAASSDSASDHWFPLFSELFQIIKPEFLILPKKNR